MVGIGVARALEILQKPGGPRFSRMHNSNPEIGEWPRMGGFVPAWRSLVRNHDSDTRGLCQTAASLRLVRGTINPEGSRGLGYSALFLNEINVFNSMSERERRWDTDSPHAPISN